MADWADSLAGLLDIAGVDAAHIVGLSWGGILAQELYRRHPARAQSLVLADTYAGWTGSLPEDVWRERLQSCLRDSSMPADELVAKYVPSMFSENASHNVRSELSDVMSDFHPPGFRLMATASAVDTREVLPTIQVPTLLVWGDADARSPLDVARQLSDAIPGARLVVIPGAGHVSNLEAPERFNAEVRALLQLSVRLVTTVTRRRVEVLPDAEAVARRAAEFICERVRTGVEERGTFSLALSGGRTPARMLEFLQKELDVPWEAVDVYQVDERIAPRNDPERNLTLLETMLPDARIHAMPVEDEDLSAATARYGATLPDRLDLVHLGLGEDGHTASLVPDCAALGIVDRDVAISREYEGRRRMTLTYPAIDRAREVLWVVTGEDKAEALAKLLAGDESIPAARRPCPGSNTADGHPGHLPLTGWTPASS